jgi:hypothetical protein
VHEKGEEIHNYMKTGTQGVVLPLESLFVYVSTAQFGELEKKFENLQKQCLTYCA